MLQDPGPRPPTVASAPADPVRARTRFWLGLVAPALLVVAAQLLHPQALLPRLTETIRGAGWAGPVLLGLLYVPAALTGVPLAALTFAGGWLIGPVPAFLVAVPSCTVASCAAMMVGRALAGDPRFLARGEGRLARMIRSLETRRAFWAIVLLRLSPVTPFAALNFAFGATPVPVATYALATLLGSVPACLAFALAGAMLGQGR